MPMLRRSGTLFFLTSYALGLKLPQFSISSSILWFPNLSNLNVLRNQKNQKIRLQINLSILLYTFFNSLQNNYEVLSKVLFIYLSIIYLPQCLSSVLRLEVFSKKLFLCLYTRSKNCFSCCLMDWQSAAMLKLQYSFVILSEMP